MPLLWRRISIAAGELVLVLQDDVDATDDEWATGMTDLRATAARLGGFDKIFVLVVTDGGRVSAGQRRILADMLAGRTLRAAVLSGVRLPPDSGAMRWFNPGIRFFDVDDVAGWIAHLPMTRADRAAVRRELEAMSRRVEARTLERVWPWLSGSAARRS